MQVPFMDTRAFAHFIDFLRQRGVTSKHMQGKLGARLRSQEFAAA